MTTAFTPSSQPAPRCNYVLLRAGTLRLLLPQQDVGEVEHLNAELCASDEPSQLKLRNSESMRKFIVPSEHLEPLPQRPSSRFIVTQIGTDDLGWCWDELRILLAPTLEVQSLPNILRAEETPFSEYVELDGNLAYLCTASQLRAATLGGN